VGKSDQVMVWVGARIEDHVLAVLGHPLSYEASFLAMPFWSPFIVRWETLYSSPVFEDHLETCLFQSVLIKGPLGPC
jgi:hypothetical protein